MARRCTTYASSTITVPVTRPCVGIESMKSRYVPYATTPGRLLAQLFSDIVVAIWTFVWVLVGLAVYSAVSTIAEEIGRAHV